MKLFNFFKNDSKTEPEKTTSTKKFGFKSIFRFSEINKQFYQELEEKLIEADAGGKNSIQIVEQLKTILEEQKVTDREVALGHLKKIISDRFHLKSFPLSNQKLNVIVMIGVNGAGKTTTISKLTKYLLDNPQTYQSDTFGKKGVLLGAADTFRAAAKEQLEEWGNRLGVQVIGQQAGADAASVAFDTIQSALAKNAGVAIIDTAGRLHNKVNLIAQLEKMERVINKFESQINLINLLVLDATLGQSGFEQAKAFHSATKIDGIVLTKVDTLARGGILISISEIFNIPVFFITHGEKMENLSLFNIDEYLGSFL